MYRVDPNTLHREDATQLGMNDIGRVRLTLFRPLFLDEYERNRATGSFVLIDPLTNLTVGAGMVSDRLRAADVRTETAQQPVSGEITWHRGRVDFAERAKLLRQQPATVWLTGLSASGKSTIAFELERRLIGRGHACFVLDGDNIRHGLSRDLGFTPQDRTENIRRIAQVAHLLNEAGLIVITAFISPYAQDRELARQVIGPDRFLETYLAADLSTCEQRDPKGLYAKARNGRIAEFTGVSAPYEPPERPALSLDTASQDVDACVRAILKVLSDRLDSA